MDYKLALSLKEAGFPQKLKVGFDFYDHQGERQIAVRSYDGDGDDQWIVIPTLEELIEACGEKFASLDRTQRDTWRFCQRMEDDEIAVSFSSYHTPTEAVARLWLALNRK